MTLNQIRTFLAIAETGSVQGAADKLFVTASAVSASLATLQRSVGFNLVERNGRGVMLTDAGKVYANRARLAIGMLDEALTAAAAQADVARAPLRIAATTTAGEQIVPRMLASFRQRHPNIAVSIEVGNRTRVRSCLDHHEVDLLLAGRPASHGNVTVLGVRSHELIVVAPPDEAAELRGTDVQTWLLDKTWLLREEGSGTREATQGLIADLHLECMPRTLTVSSNCAVRESVAAGLGVTLISRDAVARDLAQGHLAEVPLPGTPVPKVWCLTANSDELPATARALVAHLLMTGQFCTPEHEHELAPRFLRSS